MVLCTQGDSREPHVSLWLITRARKVSEYTGETTVPKYRYAYFHISIHLVRPYFQMPETNVAVVALVKKNCQHTTWPLGR